MILNNQVEAQLLSALLTEEGIPHFLRSFHDSAYDGIFQTQFGWGRLESDPRHHDRVIELLSALRHESSNR
ncbi:MAG: hypothetical protein EA382_05235 [Spirochaetaceae bacterium]|nr:MAG: hypothetical protein EA382_05235 [Spirochaetaceae bacterium]